jgi:hypothetical protein
MITKVLCNKIRKLFESSKRFVLFIENPYLAALNDECTKYEKICLAPGCGYDDVAVAARFGTVF